MDRKPNKRVEMTAEQKKVIDRLMAAALKSWDAELIRSCAESGAQTQELLIKSISRKDAEMAKLAISYGADVHALVETAGRKFQPVLHYAHENFDEAVFALVLGRGVPIDLKNPMGETVAQLAARKGDFERMRFYVDRGADISGTVQDIMFSAIVKKDADMLNWSLDRGADVTALRKETSGALVGALHVSYGYFSEDIAKILLQKGLDVNARSSTGETVLHLCAQNVDEDKTKFFLLQGADPLAASFDGTSVLDAAMAALEKANRPRDYDRDYSYSRSSFNAPAQETAKEKARRVLGLLLDAVKETYGREPYNVVSGRDITIRKPVTFNGKKDAGKDKDAPSPKDKDGLSPRDRDGLPPKGNTP